MASNRKFVHNHHQGNQEGLSPIVHSSKFTNPVKTQANKSPYDRNNSNILHPHYLTNKFSNKIVLSPLQHQNQMYKTESESKAHRRLKE